MAIIFDTLNASVASPTSSDPHSKFTACHRLTSCPCAFHMQAGLVIRILLGVYKSAKTARASAQASSRQPSDVSRQQRMVSVADSRPRAQRAPRSLVDRHE